MPIDPGKGERLARRVSELYAEAELGLLRRIARTLSAGLEAPTWAATKVLELGLLRARMGQDLADLEQRAVGTIRETIGLAWLTGQATAVQDLDDLERDIVMPPARARAVEVIAAETIGIVSQVRPAALRAATDIYQRVVGEAAAVTILGAETRRTAAQGALDRFAGRGITGFRDTAGRNWDMSSYTEMAVRTGTGRAAVQGHMDQLQANGMDLVRVSDAPRECPLCREFEGKILSLSGGVVGTIERPSATTGAPVRVRVYATLDDARRRGLFHPNCRHSTSAYLPGATRTTTETADRPGGYAAQQRQRAIERGIREWKRRSALALDDAAAAAADRKVKEWQGRLRQHLADNPDLKRQTSREQVGKAR